MVDPCRKPSYRPYTHRIHMVELDGEVKRWGNSYGVRLSKGAAEEEGLQPGDKVHVSLQKIVTPNPDFFGLAKRYPAKRKLTYAEFKREEQRVERAAERRKGL